MKCICKRITALFLVLLMTASLLTSCANGVEKEDDDPKTIATYDDYVGNVINLGLAANETILDIMEVDGELRATIGVEKREIEGTEVSPVNGTPYLTEYRYFSMDFFGEYPKTRSNKFQV